jgi:hypothetical protein
MCPSEGLYRCFNVNDVVKIAVEIFIPVRLEEWQRGLYKGNRRLMERVNRTVITAAVSRSEVATETRGEQVLWAVEVCAVTSLRGTGFKEMQYFVLCFVIKTRNVHTYRSALLIRVP